MTIDRSRDRIAGCLNRNVVPCGIGGIKTGNLSAALAGRNISGNGLAANVQGPAAILPELQISCRPGISLLADTD